MTDVNPREWGIEPDYEDAFGQRRVVPDRVQRAVLAAMGLDGETPPTPAIEIGRRGETLSAPARLRLEDGSDLGPVAALPADLPFGYHRLEREGGEALLIVGPGRCHLPPGLRAWAWAVQLYALRSEESWGIGDLGDLRALASWSLDVGARYVVVNPLWAPSPVPPQEPSPYFPSTRRYRSPLYLRVEEVLGAAEVDLEPLATAGRALNVERLIDRDAIYTLKMRALEAIWSARPDLGGLERYRSEQGSGLREWSTFVALAERFGAGWGDWPEELRRPQAAAVARFAAEEADRIAFHEWIQWLLDEQLGRAAEGIGLVQDVPVGVERYGADAWAWQDLLAVGASIGAPPDRFNTAGQDWSLPPFIPHRLRAAGYTPFIETLRASMRHADGLRIDHVMGLFRLWWIPMGSGPAAGAYVRYPTEEMLEIVALESERAGAIVIGEDLGTVEPDARRRLTDRNILSYRLLYFEQRPIAKYPELALAAVTTHDLPTIAGAWLGTDLDDQRRTGLAPDEAGLAVLRERLESAPGVTPASSVRDVVESAHASLAAGPSMLVAATLDDALCVEERPNIPGTTRERPNWSIALPASLEQIRDDPFVRRVAALLRR